MFFISFSDEQTSNQTAIRTALHVQSVMKDIMKMTKEDLKRQLQTKEDSIDTLRQHGHMETRTIDNMRLTLLTAAVFEYERR